MSFVFDDKIATVIGMTKVFVEYLILVLMIFVCSQEAICSDDWPFEMTAQSRPGTRFWCPGSALDKDNIDWNLQQLQVAGFGTIEVTPIYGAKGYEDHYINYLSPEWMEMFGYLVSRAKELGLQVDMVTGTGWNFGGPDIPEQYEDIRVNWQPDKKELDFIAGRMVKRAAPGGAGRMLNPFSPEGMDYYLQRFTKAFHAYTGILPRAQYHDSFEYSADWTTNLFDQFQKRPGYDFKLYLETFSDETSEDNRDLKTRLKYDYRYTLTELHLEYIQKWVQWSKDRGMLTRNQAHGSPTNLLDSYALADIPETEIFGSPDFPIPGFRREQQFCREGDNNPFIMKMSSSAVHVGHQPGRQLVSSESFTWLREHWHSTLGQMKLSADLFFLAGINHMFYHGTCYSPKDAPWPGWFFYASVHADCRNSIWKDIRYLNDYIARCQSVLQNSQPANDILVYWPIHDLWMEPGGMLRRLGVHNAEEWMTGTSIEKVSNLLQKKGFTFDYVSDRLLQKLSFSNGLIQAPGGKYGAIVIPVCRYMPVETLEQLTQLLQAGALVIFEKSLPCDVPGLARLDQRREKFAIAKSKLQKTAKVTSDVIQSLNVLKIAREPMADSGLSFIRRKIDNHYWYFIANHSANPVDQWIPFGINFKYAMIYDPMTGKVDNLVVKQNKNQSQIYLQLASGQSIILKTSNIASSVPTCKYLQPCGQTIALQGPWEVDFIKGAPEPPEPYTADKLVSWTEFPVPAVEAFAGTARYSIKFDVPEDMVDDWVLDLGDVRESARLRINGHNAGVLFAIPYRMNIGQFLKPGKNTLEVEVTNLTANRIRALDKRGVNWKIMNDANIVNIDYEEFNAEDWPLQPSGLLGPVQLIRMQKKVFEGRHIDACYMKPHVN